MEQDPENPKRKYYVSHGVCNQVLHMFCKLNMKEAYNGALQSFENTAHCFVFDLITIVWT